MNTDGNTTAIERMLNEREEHDERQDAEQEIADLRDEVDALAAKLAEWQAAQHYTYIGKDGKPVLARDLEARAEAAEAALPAVYQLALADTYLSRDVPPDPTAAELMARIQTGEKE